jgi:hypothetical protein
MQDPLKDTLEYIRILETGQTPTKAEWIEIFEELVENYGYHYPQLDETAAVAEPAGSALTGIGQLAGGGAAGALAGKAAAKMGSRFIPGVGTGIDAVDAYHRWKEGDRTGAVISALGAAGGLIPGLGGAISTGAAGINIGRDAYKHFNKPSSGEPAQTQPTAQPTKPGFDPKVKALQDKILAKDPNALPKYGADGRMGSETQAAMKKYGITAESKEDITMTESERIAALRARLEQIELDESAASVAADVFGNIRRAVGGGAGNTAASTIRHNGQTWEKAAGTADTYVNKATGQSLAGHELNTLTKGAPAAPAAAPKAPAAAPAAAPGAPTNTKNAIQKMKDNPGKTALAAGTAGLVGGAVGSALGGGGAAEPVTVQPSGGGGSGGGSGGGAVKPPAPSGGVDQKALDELDQLARIIGKSQDKSAIELMGQYNAIRKGLPAATTVAGEMDESITRYIKLVDGN